ncbi:uncharacterized protein TrAtP1_003271 [Trichoderma atroviride]|uniref:uncharacterized protein n=1 Tax=Hypocrea atroviridis TaxID=63577 RepID=UPI003325F353|nr:hypothetical protein TrAtP1_003271 [Trichoderma atroviride]
MKTKDQHMDESVQVQYQVAFRHFTLGQKKKYDRYAVTVCRQVAEAVQLSATVFFVGSRNPQLSTKLVASTRLALREAKPIMNLALSELAQVLITRPCFTLFVGLLSLW